MIIHTSGRKPMHGNPSKRRLPTSTIVLGIGTPKVFDDGVFKTTSTPNLAIVILFQKQCCDTLWLQVPSCPAPVLPPLACRLEHRSNCPSLDMSNLPPTRRLHNRQSACSGEHRTRKSLYSRPSVTRKKLHPPDGDHDVDFLWTSCWWAALTCKSRVERITAIWI